MPSRRAPWPLHLAGVVTWLGVGFPAFALIARRPEALADPLWPPRALLYLAWLGCYAGATWGEVEWDDRRRLAFLAAQSACALGLLWTAPRSSVAVLLLPVAGEAAFLLSARRAVVLVALQSAAMAAVFGAALPPMEG